jgi:hypothetical protein
MCRSDVQFEAFIWGLPWTIDDAEGFISGMHGPKKNFAPSALYIEFKVSALPGVVKGKPVCESNGQLLKPIKDFGLELIQPTT